MGIGFEVLGGRSRDNALLMTVDSGRGITELLFDCGEGCLDGLGKGRRRGIDALFFSHLHMDHVAGFDGLFRHIFARRTRPNLIWGPDGTAVSMQHRFRGFVWNMLGKRQASWIVEDITAEGLIAARFEFAEAFAVRHDAGSRPFAGPIWQTPDFTVDALILDHGIDSIAYIVRETPSLNIDMQALASAGLSPGPWLQALKGSDDTVEVDGETRALAPLRERLLTRKRGKGVAYLTDFYLDEAGIERIAPALHGVDTLICEAQYRIGDRDLAERNHHMTTGLTAKLASAAGVGRLILIHVSERYERPAQDEMLAEAQAIFPNTAFPDHW